MQINVSNVTEKVIRTRTYNVEAAGKAYIFERHFDGANCVFAVLRNRDGSYFCDNLTTDVRSENGYLLSDVSRGVDDFEEASVD